MDLQTILSALVTFIGTTLVYFLMGVALFIFVWNAFRYFVVKGASDEGRQKAKSLAIWGILAFVILVSLWGIVNFIRANLGIDNYAPTKPDYMQERQFGPPPQFDPSDPCSAAVDLEECMNGNLGNTA